MALAPIVKDSSGDGRTLFNDNTEVQASYVRLGALNGLLVGLTLAMGSLGVEAVVINTLPMPLRYPSLILTTLALALLGGLAGWLSGRFKNTALTFLIWLVTSILMSVVVGYQAYQIRTLVIWLADPRFWGLSIYAIPYSTAVWAGFFIILVLLILALLQDYRLERIQGELGENQRLTGKGWFLLLLPLFLVVAAGLITGEMSGNNPFVQATALVHQAIQTGRTYEGNLLDLARERGVNYNAIRGVREQMSAEYTLMVGEVDPAMATTIVVASFSNGAWINCRIINDQLSHCYDASPPYTIGLANLITGEEIPEDCLGCTSRVSEEWQEWLESRRNRFGNSPPQIYRLAQQGSYVLMRAESEAGDYAVECRFHGLQLVQLEHCVEVNRAR